MLNFLYKFTLVTTFALAVFSLAARVLGSTQPPNPTLSGFTEGCEDQPQPCWYGIVPGVTNITVVPKQLESRGYKLYDSNNIYFYFSNQINGITKAETCSEIIVSSQGDTPTVFSILLRRCDGIVLGDLSQLGFPEKVGPSTVKLEGYYAAEIKVIDINQPIEWSPNTQVQDLSMAKGIELLGSPWRGFVPHWRYCQLEPQYQDCP